MKTLYERLKDEHIPMDSHESDLYVLATPRSTQVIREYLAESQCPLTRSGFRHAVTGEWWYDIPFMYQPWWDARSRKEV